MRNTAKRDLGVGAVTKFLVRVGSTLPEVFICLGQPRPDLAVFHSPRAFAPSQIPRHQFIAKSSEPFPPWESPGRGRFQGEAALGVGMLLFPIPGKAGPKAARAPAKGCAFVQGAWQPRCPGPSRERGLRHDSIGIGSLQVVPGPWVWELCWG